MRADTGVRSNLAARGAALSSQRMQAQTPAQNSADARPVTPYCHGSMPTIVGDNSGARKWR